MSGPRKNRRRRRTAPRTRSTIQLAKDSQRTQNGHHEEQRPTDRSQCKDGIRPCPWVGCRHHLYLDVNPENGSIKFNFPDLEPWELTPSCSLDVTDEEGATLGEVGDYMNLSRERIRQIEVAVLERLHKLVKGIIDDKANKK